MRVPQGPLQETFPTNPVPTHRTPVFLQSQCPKPPPSPI
jgi:hypothetical protein